jgi:hypothetical protein
MDHSGDGRDGARGWGGRDGLSAQSQPPAVSKATNHHPRRLRGVERSVADPPGHPSGILQPWDSCGAPSHLGPFAVSAASLIPYTYSNPAQCAA